MNIMCKKLSLTRAKLPPTPVQKSLHQVLFGVNQPSTELHMHKHYSQHVMSVKQYTTQEENFEGVVILSEKPVTPQRSTSRKL